jgi:hypothetical protein
MAGDVGCAEKQNEIRREQKRRQAIGRGKAKKGIELEEGRIDRHVTGHFCGTTEQAIAEQFQRYPEQPITSEFFRQLMKNDGIQVDVGGIHGELTVTATEIQSKLKVYSVTVFTSGGYGIKFKSLPARGDLPSKVIVL